MSGGILFAAGWAGASVVVGGVVVGVRSWQDFDPWGPGTGSAKRGGCRCSRRRNWLGWRESLTSRSYLAEGCPFITHRPDARARAYERRSQERRRA